MTFVVPSLNGKSANSSSPFLPAPPLMLTTPFSSTFGFFPASATESFAISGRDSVLDVLARDFYHNINKNEMFYLECLMTEVLDDCFHFIVSVEIGRISGWVQFLLEVWLEGVNNESDFQVGI